MTYTNAGVQAGGTLTVISGGDTTVEVGNLRGQDVDLDIGGDLTVTSVQDLFKSKSISAGVDIGFTNGGSIGGSFNYASADRGWTTNQTSIIAENIFDAKVDGDTTLIGSVLNSESGDLTL